MYIIISQHTYTCCTALLAGLLSRVVPLRRSMCKDPQSSVQPLKLLIMSATLRMDDFTANRRLFPVAPPLVHVPARQYPVTLHFNRRTELDDFVGAAYQKVGVMQTALLFSPQASLFVGRVCLALALVALLDSWIVLMSCAR